MTLDSSQKGAHPTQTLFLRPRFNVVAAKGGMRVEVRAEPENDERAKFISSFLPGREKARA